ncbi:hypothetical protein MTR67_043837 [Solanum verrucosum]|uniref:Uncharacterized protein n=1 Tax=Solanum verrucosum TaxID=315347 RepID=A0AAF0UQ48_SOLVR|nr:hypothetical protein MTR67_043837 [Solanum verrucosum]
MEGGNTVATADLGGTVLAGTLENPLGLWERQLSYTLHKVRDQCLLYRANEKPVDEYLDKKKWRLLITHFWIRQASSGKKFSQDRKHRSITTTQWFRPNVVITRIFKPGGSDIPLEGQISYLLEA